MVELDGRWEGSRTAPAAPGVSRAMTARSCLRAGLAGLAGGVAWFLGILLVFGPAQAVLGDPDLQSAKLLAVFSPEGAAPRMIEAPALVLAGLLGIGVLWGWMYVWLAASWTGAWWGRGLRFGGIGWVLMVPWFEFYLPWNVLLEPAPLVALELVCWAVVLVGVGLAIAGVETLLRGRSGRGVA